MNSLSFKISMLVHARLGMNIKESVRDILYGSLQNCDYKNFLSYRVNSRITNSVTRPISNSLWNCVRHLVLISHCNKKQSKSVLKELSK